MAVVQAQTVLEVTTQPGEPHDPTVRAAQPVFSYHKEVIFSSPASGRDLPSQSAARAPVPPERFVQLRHLLLELGRLVGRHLEAGQVGVAVLGRLEVAQLRLHHVRAEQRVGDERARQSGGTQTDRQAQVGRQLHTR